MTVKITQFKSTIAEITDVPNLATSDVNNPFLTKIKFIFSDNQGNGNKQGIKEDEFDAIAESAVNMPIKIDFDGEGPRGHELSVPIGHITSMTKEKVEGIETLVGEALLYREEFPEQVEYLKKSHSEGKAPGISWELAYHDSVLEGGIEWLKQAITMAATFVKVPAYGSRTKLLAIASQELTEEELIEKIKDVVNSMASTTEPKGGNEVEEELEQAKSELDELKAKVADLEGKLTEATATIDTLTQENTAYKTQATLADRVAKISEAGLKFELEGDALTEKHNFWLSMSEEVFTAYVADLVAAKGTKSTASSRADASQRQGSLPRFTAVAGQEVSLDDLKAVARRASRGDLAEI